MIPFNLLLFFDSSFLPITCRRSCWTWRWSERQINIDIANGSFSEMV